MAYQLTDMFDKEKVLGLLHGDSEKYNKLIGDRNLDNSLLTKQMKLYESGKAFELPEGFLKRLEDSDILFEYGYEWIRSLKDDKREKQKLVKNNPFLPYSLIVVREDMARIRNMEFEGTIPAILPILEKEKLEEVLTAKTGKNVYSLGMADFLISFDDRILNKNYLIEVMEEIKTKVNKNNEILEKAQGALRNTEIGILKVEGFTYTRQYVEKLEQDSKTIDMEIKYNEENVGSLQERIRELSERITESYKIGSSLENRRMRFQRKKEDILGFINRQEGYTCDLGKMEQKEADRKVLEAAIKAIEQENHKAKEKVQEKAQLIVNITASLDKDRNSYEKYRNAGPGNEMAEGIEQLESRLRVLTSDSNGKIQNLQEILEDYRNRRREKGKERLALQIEEQAYLGQEYHEFELETVEKELGEINHKIMQLSEEKNGLQFIIAEKQSDLKYVAKNIRERYGYEDPLPKESIRNMDFAGEKEKLLAVLKNLEKELAQVKIQDTILQKAMFSLEEYGIYADVGRGIPFKEEGNLQEKTGRLIKSFKEYGVLLSNAKNTLSAAYLELETEFTDKNEMFKNLFHSILDGEKKYQPLHAKNAFNRVNLQIERKLEQHSIDLKKIDDMERCIIDNTISYLMNFYDELNSIDRNSAIDINGRKCKMLLIELPEKEALETIAVKEYLKETIRKCENLYRQGKTTESFLLNEISTYYLFDRLAGINKIHINLMKIEPNRLKKKSWKQVIEENSGGEKFVSAFVVFISLMTYMRGENLLGDNTESKVLIMDNPFGPITSEHLLKPLFEIAKKYNTQMICLSDLKEHTIFDRFNLIYSLNIEREVGREEEYIELKTIKKDVLEQEDEILSASMFKIEDRSRFERVN